MKQHDVEIADPESPGRGRHGSDGLPALGRNLAAREAAAILGMQRTAGNAAVTRMLHRRSSRRARKLARDPSLDSRMPSGFQLDGLFVTLHLPGNTVLHATTFADLKTDPGGATVTVRVSRSEIRLYFDGIFVEGAIVARSNVRSITIGLGAEYFLIDVDKGENFGLDESAKVYLDLNQWLHQTFDGVLPLGSSYDAFSDSDLRANAQKIVGALQKSGGGGGSSTLTGSQVGIRNVSARVLVTNAIEKEKDGAGVVIPAGTAIALTVETGTTIGKLQDAADGSPQGLFNAANVQKVRLRSNGITVMKGGDPVASIDEIALAGGKVTVTGLTLLGKAREYARTEQGLLALGSFIFGQMEGLPPELALRKTVLDNPQATLVPGITRATIESALQDALNEFVAQNGATIGGVDLSSVLGSPSAKQ